MLKQILAREISKVKAARSESTSLRVTIPQRVAIYLKIKNDDFVEWELLTEKGEAVVKLRKLK